MSALVIKDWKVDTRPVDSQKNFVRITGRESGLFAWLLSVMKVDPTTTIRIGTERLEFSCASLAGTESRLIPLQNICSSYYGYHKPWKAALSILSGFIFFGAQLRAATPLLVCSALGLLVAVVYYVLNRTLTLGFVEHSGVSNGIRFKRSVIENKDISEQQAKEVCIIMQRLIEAKSRHQRAAS